MSPLLSAEEKQLLKTRFEQIQNQVAVACQQAGRARDSVILIAVSKIQSVEAIQYLYSLGQKDFGENYVQELCEKKLLLPNEIRFHFIGHLQTNKVKSVINAVSSVHTLDSLKLAQELQKKLSQMSPTKKLPVFIEVNIDNEPTKAGVGVSETAAFCREISETCPLLEIQGLMCIPNPARAHEAGEASAFQKLSLLEKQCRPWTKGALSMGMTADFATAIKEGATHIRVGTAIFGERKSIQN